MDLVFAPSQIESWPIDRLRPYARNAKMHGDDQVAKIAASMAKFGWTVPCMVADDGELIAGHGRVLAATMLGLTEVPVIRLGHLDEAERRAYRIADNKLTELGEWDEAMLRDEIAGLLAEDFDLSLLGIGDDDLDALLRDPEALGGDGPVEGEDDVPDMPVTPDRCRATSGNSAPPADLRRQHVRRCGRALAGGCDATADGDRPTLWRGIRSLLAQPGGRGQDEAYRQGAER
jgi:ParB-like chromosome segregation protein Spo0J